VDRQADACAAHNAAEHAPDYIRPDAAHHFTPLQFAFERQLGRLRRTF
jgi:hypothetical protein